MNVWFYAKYMKPLLEKKARVSIVGGWGEYFIALESNPILLAQSVSYTHNAKDSKSN